MALSGAVDLGGMDSEEFTFDLDFTTLSSDDLAQKQAGGLFSSGPVREESLLSSWTPPNWIVEEGRVRQLRSRSRERESRRQRVLRETSTMKPYVVIRNPPVSILACGDWRWTDYVLKGSLRGGVDGPTGIAFRYQDGRHYYALTVEEDRGLSLVRRQGDDHLVLGQVHLLAAAEEQQVYIEARGSRLEAGIVGGPFIRASDDSYGHGKAALVCEGESVYGPIHVEGRKVSESSLPLPPAPEMQRLDQGELAPPLRQGRILLMDLDGDGLPELAADGAEGNELHGQHLRRGLLWSLGPFEHPLSRAGDVPVQAFDINGDGRRELVLAADFDIRVHDAENGARLASVPTPPANPYREQAPYPHELLLADALCPLRTAPGAPPGFYLKDRYWNLWVYDCNLDLLWHRALNTGHFPLPVQLRAGEADSIFASRTMLAPNGDTLWDLDLPDHADAIGFFALRTRPGLYVASGEEGLMEIEPRSGEILTQHRRGHVQYYTVGKFVADRPGYQLLTGTQWREPGICVLYDDELNVLRRWPEMCLHLGNQALPWGCTGTDLVVSPAGILDPLTGCRLRPLPPGCGSVRHLAVLDLPHYGPGCLFVVNEENWQIWGPGANVPPVPGRHRPNTLNPAGYLPSLSF